MKIKLNQNLSVEGIMRKEGDTVDVSERTGLYYMRKGFAERVKPKKEPKTKTKQKTTDKGEQPKKEDKK